MKLHKGLDFGGEFGFQLLLKGCTIEAIITFIGFDFLSFQLLLKGCTIEACYIRYLGIENFVSVVVERMYD